MKNSIECPAERAIYFLGGKWKIRILFTLYNNKKVRFNILKRGLKTITQQMLSKQLKELETDGIVSRKVHQLVKSNNLDNLFEDLFSIEEVGIYKPDSKVYDMPIKKYNIQKNEVAFLSANTWDVSGGGNYGYNSIWVNRNNNIFDNLDYKPQNEIKNLKELLNII